MRKAMSESRETLNPLRDVDKNRITKLKMGKTDFGLTTTEHGITVVQSGGHAERCVLIM